MSTVALRTALIWHDEVMSDVVVEKPTKITLGATGKATFVVPDVGLPAEFAIVRPGNRGYLLTLGEHMRGTICIDGQERDVEELVRKEAAGGFCATPISGRDWGVIDLDGSGHHKLFFQFVPLEEAPQFFTPKVIAGGLGGYLLASMSLTVMWWLTGQALSEAVFRGLGITTLAVAVGALGWSTWQQDGDSKASLAFSIVLHAALLYTTFALYDGEDPFVWPGPRAMTGQYLVTRLEPEPEPEPVRATVDQASQEAAAAASKTRPKKPTATKNPEGASGGKGETERARHEDAKDDDKPAPPRVALLDRSNEKEIQNIADRAMAVDVGKFMGIPGVTKEGSVGYGKGDGSGTGDRIGGTGTTRGSKGKGKGGGGNVEGDFESKKGRISTGKDRPGGDCVGPNCTGAAPKEVKVTIANPSGDFGGYTEDEINRVVKARAGIFRACYQRELNRSPGIGGKLVIRFKIGANGKVASAAKAGGSSLSNSAVEACVKSNVMRLQFPPKGAIANVIYPFVFTQGG
jgi:hypothetical protein